MNPPSDSNSPKQKQRIDLLLVEQGHCESRAKAQALILAGQVLVDDEPVTKAGQEVRLSSVIRIRGDQNPFVSRGGLKLQKALEVFEVEVTDREAMDIGASTGGFTDVLLQAGAKHVLAIDVGSNQLHWKIRNDPRVTPFDNVNARHLEFEQIGKKVDLLVMDLSFISLAKVIPALIQFAKTEADFITLIKPQFELEPEKVGKGGIVREDEHRQEAVNRVTTELQDLGLTRLNLIESPIRGAQGNTEYLAHWKLADEQTKS